MVRVLHYFSDYFETSLIVSINESTSLQKIKHMQGSPQSITEGSQNHLPTLKTGAR